MANPLPLSDSMRSVVLEPRTPDEWRAHIGDMLMVRLSGGAGTLWTPGHKLTDVQGDWAIVQPPNHGHQIKVPLRGIKLWQKGNARIQELQSARKMMELARELEETGGVTLPPRDTRVINARANMDGWFVIRDQVTGKYFGTTDDKPGFGVTLQHASAWEQKSSAYSALREARRKDYRLRTVSAEYATMAEARKLDAVAALPEPETLKIIPFPTKATEPEAPVPEPEPPAAEVAPPAPQPEISTPAPAPAPVAVAQPVAEPPKPVPTLADWAEQAKRINVYTKWKEALAEEAAARSLHLEAQGKLAIAEAAMQAEKQRQAWGLP